MNNYICTYIEFCLVIFFKPMQSIEISALQSHNLKLSWAAKSWFFWWGECFS